MFVSEYEQNYLLILAKFLERVCIIRVLQFTTIFQSNYNSVCSMLLYSAV